MNTLQEQIDNYEMPSYAYTYPSTRAYAPIQPCMPHSGMFTKELNIYIHIPFCNQKCTFCGYLVTVEQSGELQERYVAYLIKEIEMHQHILKQSTITSINFGGGTPSLLTPKQFENIMQALLNANADILTHGQEISIEATPESIFSKKITSFKELGLNRVSIGIQSLNAEEIKISKRHNNAELSLYVIEMLQKIGIQNTCVDLMYGLQQQTLQSWEESVLQLLTQKPETIELYGTALIPNTPLASRQHTLMSNSEKYQCYDIARELLINAGYVQECHLRFALPNKGGYKQQEHAFHGQSILGFGAGARTYAKDMHYRNSYSTNGRNAIMEYMTCIHKGRYANQSGVTLNNEEKMRRYIIYQIEHLDKQEFYALFGAYFESTFANIYNQLLSLDLAHDDGTYITLTSTGLRYRDLIARQFFSTTLATQESEYWQKPLQLTRRGYGT